MKYVLLLALWCAVAHADTRRIAIVVGNNAGAADQTPLRYAEADAGKLARVLGELGGVKADDLFLLQGKDLASVSQAFTQAKARIAQREPGQRVILVFYFSGHSDGQALELGRDRLAYGDLRTWLAAAGADVRIALVDSCKSGALLQAKGGTRGPAFQIRLSDDLASTGEALLTSSAADEVALESKEIGGSFFTHHFVSGLRGAADTSGDGIVTLAEAYQYAYAHTIKTTGDTIIGPQHPAYDYRLSGQGELVLTELAKPTASVELPKGFSRGLVIDVARDQVIAELTSDVRPVIAVQPGLYAVRAWREGKVLAGRVAVAANERRSVHWDELSPATDVATRSKGDDDLGVAARLASDGERPALGVAVGVSGGVATGVGAVPSLVVDGRLASGWSLSLAAGSRSVSGFRETSIALLAGYRVTTAPRAVRAWAGVEGGPGFVTQSPAMGSLAYTAAAMARPAVGAFAHVTHDVAVELSGRVPVAVLERDGKLAAVPLPALWLGILVNL